MAFSTKGIAVAAIATCAVATMITFIPPEGIKLGHNNTLSGDYVFQSKENFAKKYNVQKQKQGSEDREYDKNNPSGSASIEETPGFIQGLWSKEDGTNVTPEEFNEHCKLVYGSYFDSYYEYLGVAMKAEWTDPVDVEVDKFKNKFGDVGLIHYHQNPGTAWGGFNQNVVNGGSATIGSSGCGPTALSAALSTMLHKYITPLEIVAARDTMYLRLGEQPGYMNAMWSGGNRGSTAGAMVQGSTKVCEFVGNLKYNGQQLLECSLGTLDQNKVDDTLSKDGFIILVPHADTETGKYWTGGGHYIAIREKDSSGLYYTTDGSHDSDNSPRNKGNHNVGHEWSDLQNCAWDVNGTNSVHYIIPGPGYESYISSLGDIVDSTGDGTGGSKLDAVDGEIVLPTTDKYYKYLFKDGSGKVPEMKCVKYESISSNKNGKTVYLDPGHGKGVGVDYTERSERTIPLSDDDKIWGGQQPLLGQGVESKYPEDEFNWDVANQVKDLLLARGYDVVMSKKTINRSSSNGGSARLASLTSDIMVSIHWNGSTGSYNSDGSINKEGTADGTFIYYLEESPIGSLNYNGVCASLGISTEVQQGSKKLANIMLTKVSSVGFKKNEAQNSMYRIFAYSDIPTVIIETGFGDNANDRVILDTKRPEIAKAIADGVDEYFGN